MTDVKRKRKPVMSFQVDDELRSQLKDWANKNGNMSESAAIRFMLLDFLRRNVILSNDESDEKQS